MKEIGLTRGLKAIVDDEDFERVNAYSWQAKKFYSRPNSFYAVGMLGNRHISMHRFILDDFDMSHHIDHANRDGLDNRKSNLRTCNHQQNQANSRLSHLNTSGFRGVTKSHRLWRAKIRVNNYWIELGSFDHKEDAARAYDEAARWYFGEFAYQNLPCTSSAESAKTNGMFDSGRIQMYNELKPDFAKLSQDRDRLELENHTLQRRIAELEREVEEWKDLAKE